MCAAFLLHDKEDAAAEAVRAVEEVLHPRREHGAGELHFAELIFLRGL